MTCLERLSTKQASIKNGLKRWLTIKKQGVIFLSFVSYSFEIYIIFVFKEMFSIFSQSVEDPVY